MAAMTPRDLLAVMVAITYAGAAGTDQLAPGQVSPAAQVSVRTARQILDAVDESLRPGGRAED